MKTSDKLRENFALICQFLLGKTSQMPEGGMMDVNLKIYVGHYANITISNKDKPKLWIYEKDVNLIGRNTSLTLFPTDTLDNIKNHIVSMPPSNEFMRRLIVGWHKYGIKDFILREFEKAVQKANETLEDENIINNFVV
jgi:hypothetical protein